MLGTILSIAFGVGGIVTSYIFYRKTIKNQKINVFVESSILISERLNKYNNLKITYNDHTISSLTNSVVKICNVGNCSIEPDDLYKRKPITIQVSEPLLFDIDDYKVSTTNPNNNVSLIYLDNKTLQINFEILSPKEIITIEMLHNGSITIDGTLKKGKIINKEEVSYSDDKTDSVQANKILESPFDFLSFFVKLLLLSGICVTTVFMLCYTMFFPDADANTFETFIPLFGILMCLFMSLSIMDKNR